jgi:hypothetical protein
MVKEILEINKRCVAVAESALNKKVESVVSMSKEEKGWKAVVEVLERRAVPDAQDLLGRYELTLSEDGELLGYKQVLLRRRQDRLGIEFVEPRE